MNSPKLRDILYLDTEKTASILSQFEGGLLRDKQSEYEDVAERQRAASGNVQIIQGQLGKTATVRIAELESRVLHHDLLSRTESKLFSQSLALDVNHILTDADLTVEIIRSKLADAFYIRAEGWTVIEDYDRILSILEKYPALIEFFKRLAEEEVKQSDAYKAHWNQLQSAREAVATERDRNKRSQLTGTIKQAERELEQQVQNLVPQDELTDWQRKGFETFFETFLPNRITLRLYPFRTAPDFQFVANLKRGCFANDDLENILLAYGTQPNVKLTVLGLLTSMPLAIGTAFDPMQEFARLTKEESEARGFERVAREIFSGLQGLEKMFSVSRYPNVTLYPLALYRTIRRAGCDQADGHDAPLP